MGKFELSTIEKFVIRDEHCIFSLLSLVAVLLVVLNLSYLGSFLLGTLASLLYFSINILFLGHSFFDKEKLFPRILLGTLLFFLLLGLVSWATMISYNLDTLRSMVALAFLAVLSSFLNKRKRKYTEPVQEPVKAETQSNVIEQAPVWRSYPARLLFIFMFCLSTYLLLISRAEEVYTVWQYLHPLFLPAYFISTFILITILLSSEKTHVKLLFVIAQSVLSHAFFITVFPAGDVGVQQEVLATTRRIYENLTLFGYGHSSNIFMQIYYWFSGINFQSAYSVILARMFCVDVLWSHLAFIPFAWGIFIPLVTYLIARTLGVSDTLALLSSLAVLAFPATIYWGAFSVPNSLGFIFALGSLYFILRYIKSKGKDSRLLILLFSFASLVSHFLTGMIAFALLSLAIVAVAYKTERKLAPTASQFLIVVGFVFSLSILPMSLVYHRFFSPLYAVFSLYQWRIGPIEDLLGRLVLGEYFGYGPLAMALYLGGPLLGFIGIVLVLRAKSNQGTKNNLNPSVLFLLLGFVLMVVDYRILSLFMVGVPFNAERIGVFRDFIAAPFLILLCYSIYLYVRRMPLKRRTLSGGSFSFSPNLSFKMGFRSMIAYGIAVTIACGWFTASLYYAYPHYAPLQTTSYEIEAVKYINTNTPERYVVIADQWIILAGQMFVGVYNSRAYYFAHTDPKGVMLFLRMKNNITVTTMIEAMKVNNATVAYFIIEKSRLLAETYNHMIQEAEQNNIATYKVFYFKGVEKLRIFFYKNSNE